MKEIWTVFWRFLALGCISFGGPAAHIGYFQKTFVEKLNWIDAAAYARLISLSQFLPGPGSSQIGFALGLRRAGIGGGVAAFLGFSLPSCLLLYGLAVSNLSQSSSQVFVGISHGLKLLAVVVVADACSKMFKNFCQTRWAIGITLLTMALMLIVPSTMTQMGMLLLAALWGIRQQHARVPVAATSDRIKPLPLGLFLLLFVGLPLLSFWSPLTELFNAFYHSGSLVFGGGHVVLPLLQQMLGESISADRFLTGYAAAQAIPGPMFSFATYLGAEMAPNNQLWGAVLATVGIFLPGFLLVLGLHGAWESLATRPKIAGAITGINASVVGLLLAALYTPVFVSAVTNLLDMALVLFGFYAISRLKVPIVLLVLGFAALGLILSY